MTAAISRLSTKRDVLVTRYEWNNNNVWAQAQLIAYDQIRQIEDIERQSTMIKAMYGKRPTN